MYDTIGDKCCANTLSFANATLSFQFRQTTYYGPALANWYIILRYLPSAWIAYAAAAAASLLLTATAHSAYWRRSTYVVTSIQSYSVWQIHCIDIYHLQHKLYLIVEVVLYYYI